MPLATQKATAMSHPHRAWVTTWPNLEWGDGLLCTAPTHLGGVLDSSVAIKHEVLGCHAPLTPPLTILTSIHTLPPTDDASVYT